MKLKKIIQIIEYSNRMLLIGLFMILLALVARAGNGKFLAFEIFFAIPLILGFFFRKIIIDIYLKKTLYPGIFYSVLYKLGLAGNIGISLSDDLLNEIYRPAFSTSQFLSDNDLKTEIGAKKIKLPFIALSIGLAGVAIYYLDIKNGLQKNQVIFFMLLSFIAVNVYLWVKGRKQRNDNEPVAFFNEKELVLPDQKLSWKDIYDWNYQQGGKGSYEKIVINYYDPHKNIAEAIAEISDLNIDKIDFLLLLAHFKGKYGMV